MNEEFPFGYDSHAVFLTLACECEVPHLYCASTQQTFTDEIPLPRRPQIPTAGVRFVVHPLYNKSNMSIVYAM